MQTRDDVGGDWRDVGLRGKAKTQNPGPRKGRVGSIPVPGNIFYTSAISRFGAAVKALVPTGVYIRIRPILPGI